MPSDKILVVGPAWVGDMVMSQALFRLLRSRDPGAIIDVLAPAWSLPLLARMSEVRRAFPIAAGHGELAFGERWRLGRRLGGEGYTQAIILPRSFKSALVPFFARIPRRTGFRAEGRAILLTDPRVLDRSALDQTVKRLLALGIGPGEPLPEPSPPALQIDAENRRELLAKFHIGRLRSVALMPGAAYGPAKQWPAEYFAELARSLAAAGWESWVLGSAGERVLGEQIRAAAPEQVFNLCGETRLEDTVDLLSGVQAAVTNDSGLMHVAAAAGTHVVAIYGSSSPGFTPPLTARKTVLYRDLECSPCFRRECPLGHLNCLRRISVADVASAVQAIAAA
jgi:heptosyltransferase-2